MAKEETYLYMKGASGLTDRVPESELEAWKKRQEELKANGVSPERTRRMLEELNERLSRKRMELQK